MRYLLPHLGWEAAYALHEVLVGLPVAGQDCTHRRDHLERVLVIRPETHGTIHRRDHLENMLSDQYHLSLNTSDNTVAPIPYNVV